MANKTVLDLSKSLFTLYIIENIIQQKSFNYYIIYTDRIGGFISASIGTSTITAAGNDLKNYEYINFLGTKQKFYTDTISPSQSKSLYDNSQEEPGEEVTSAQPRGPVARTNGSPPRKRQRMEGSPSGTSSLQLPSQFRLQSPTRPRSRPPAIGSPPRLLLESPTRPRSRPPANGSPPGSSSLRPRSRSPQSFDGTRKQLMYDFGKKRINSFGKKIKGKSKQSMDFGKRKSLFGMRKKQKFIQEANRRSVIKGTVGMFGKWCRSQGLASSDGKVTLRCINSAKRSHNTTMIRRATFAKNIGGYLGAKHLHPRSQFGKKTKKTKKYTKLGGRKSPDVSATLYKIGTVKLGLDGNNWVIVATINGTKRWKRVSMQFGKKVKRKFRFGKFRFGNKKNLEKKREDFEQKIEKEIDIAEEIIDRYPRDDTLRRRAIRSLKQLKNLFKKLLTIDNFEKFVEKSVSIIGALSTLLFALAALVAAYNGIYSSSAIFAGLVNPLERLFNRFRKKNHETEETLQEMGRMGNGHWVFHEEEEEE
jgi:hypothetical protein